MASKEPMEHEYPIIEDNRQETANRGAENPIGYNGQGIHEIILRERITMLEKKNAMLEEMNANLQKKVRSLENGFQNFIMEHIQLKRKVEQLTGEEIQNVVAGHHARISPL